MITTTKIKKIPNPTKAYFYAFLTLNIPISLPIYVNKAKERLIGILKYTALVLLKAIWELNSTLDKAIAKKVSRKKTKKSA